MSERKTPEEMAEVVMKDFYTLYGYISSSNKEQVGLIAEAIKAGAEQARLDAIEEASLIVIEMGQHVQGGYNHCAKLMWDKIQTLKTKPDPRNDYANINKITGEIG